MLSGIYVSCRPTKKGASRRPAIPGLRLGLLPQRRDLALRRHGLGQRLEGGLEALHPVGHPVGHGVGPEADTALAEIRNHPLRRYATAARDIGDELRLD